MPSLNDLPGDIKPEKLLRALQRLGFQINAKGGKGSHVKITWQNEKSITIQRNIYKHALRVILKEIELISGITWDEIKEQL